MTKFRFLSDERFSIKRVERVAMFVAVFFLGCVVISSCKKDDEKKGEEKIPVTGVTLNDQERQLKYNGEFTLTATVTPENATDKSVTWKSSETSVADVDDNGKVTAKDKDGETIITVTTVDGAKTATCKVIVAADVIAVTGISLTEESIEMTVGAKNTLEYAIEPANATNKEVTWSVNEEGKEFVSVNQETGELTALATGEATVTVTTVDGEKTASCTITVLPIAVTGISLTEESIEMTVEEMYTPMYTITPAEATNKAVTWSVNEEGKEFVSVNQETGELTALAAGEAIVTVTTVDGEKTASCTVTVVASIKSVLMDRTNWLIPGYPEETSMYHPENNPSSEDSGNSPTIGYSSQDRSSPAWGMFNYNIILNIFDGDPSTYWHASWTEPQLFFPHWFIIDLGSEEILTHVSMTGYVGKSGQSGFEVFTCTAADAVNLEDPTTWTWERQGGFNFDPVSWEEQKYPLESLPSARYVKVYMGEEYNIYGENYPYAAVAEFNVYIVEQ